MTNGWIVLPKMFILRNMKFNSTVWFYSNCSYISNKKFSQKLKLFLKIIKFSKISLKFFKKKSQKFKLFIKKTKFYSSTNYIQKKIEEQFKVGKIKDVFKCVGIPSYPEVIDKSKQLSEGPITVNTSVPKTHIPASN